jgi:hypothetical protein
MIRQQKPPRHPRGGFFVPQAATENIDADGLAQELAKLAKKWSRKPAAKRKRVTTRRGQ